MLGPSTAQVVGQVVGGWDQVALGCVQPTTALQEEKRLAKAAYHSASAAKAAAAKAAAEAAAV
jgi:hypothetical protein